jgi:hypothetical protein
MVDAVNSKDLRAKAVSTLVTNECLDQYGELVD